MFTGFKGFRRVRVLMYVSPYNIIGAMGDVLRTTLPPPFSVCWPAFVEEMGNIPHSRPLFGIFLLENDRFIKRAASPHALSEHPHFLQNGVRDDSQKKFCYDMTRPNVTLSLYDIRGDNLTHSVMEI